LLPYGPVDAAFEEVRLSRQIQSFDDQLPFALKALLHDPAERQNARRAFDYILVDEFQDLNEAQLALIDVLTRPDRELMVVGDDDQLIYGWRYARPGNILDFEKRMPEASTVVLETNYRCAIQIVQASRRVIDNNKERVAKNITAGNDAPEGMVCTRPIRSGASGVVPSLIFSGGICSNRKVAIIRSIVQDQGTAATYCHGARPS